MDHVILEKEVDSCGTGYRHRVNNHSDMYNLSAFLTDDVGPRGASRWIEWLLDGIPSDAESNHCFLEKENNDLVLIGTIPSWLCDEDPYWDSFQMPIPQLVYLLEQWKKVWEDKPDEVIITRENNVYMVIQKNNDMSQA